MRLILVTVAILVIFAVHKEYINLNGSNRILQEYALRFFKSHMHFKENGAIFNAWKSPGDGVKARFKAHIFNITNPQEVEDGEALPILQDVGPYTYNLKASLLNITYHDLPEGETRVDYTDHKRFFFNPDESSGSPSDSVYAVDIANLEARKKTRSDSFFGGVISLMANRIVSEVTVDEVGFRGYGNVLKGLNDFMSNNEDTEHNGIISYFGKMNTSRGDRMSIYTGERDPTTLNKLYSVNGKTGQTFWKQESCEKGTAGFFHGVDRNASAPVVLYVAPFCRGFRYEYDDQNPVEIEHLQTYTYRASKDSFNSNIDSFTNCFFTNKTFKSGAMDIEQCLKAPLVLSFPHYLYADQFYTDQVRGLSAEEEAHRPYIVVDALTGVTVQVRFRVQVGVATDKFVNKTKENQREDGSYEAGALPLFWIDIQYDLTKTMVRKLALVRYVFENMAYILFWTLAVSLFLISYAFSVLKERRRRKGVSAITKQQGRRYQNFDEFTEDFGKPKTSHDRRK